MTFLFGSFKEQVEAEITEFPIVTFITIVIAGLVAFITTF